MAKIILLAQAICFLFAITINGLFYFSKTNGVNCDKIHQLGPCEDSFFKFKTCNCLFQKHYPYSLLASSS